jgi:hypothetical protein
LEINRKPDEKKKQLGTDSHLGEAGVEQGLHEVLERVRTVLLRANNVNII